MSKTIDDIKSLVIESLKPKINELVKCDYFIYMNGITKITEALTFEEALAFEIGEIFDNYGETDVSRFTRIFGEFLDLMALLKSGERLPIEELFDFFNHYDELPKCMHDDLTAILNRSDLPSGAGIACFSAYMMGIQATL